MPLKTRESADQSVVQLQHQFNQQKNNSQGEYTQTLGSTDIGRVKLNKSASPKSNPIQQTGSNVERKTPTNFMAKYQGEEPAEEEDSKDPTKTDITISQEERRAALRAREEARVAKQEAEKTLAEARKLSGAKDAISKGDLNALAQSFGMTVPEYIQRINQMAMGLPDKEVPPEELKKRQEEEWRAQQDENAKNMKLLAQRIDIKEYIGDNITPLLIESKENYPLLLEGEDRKQVEFFVYEFINKQYIDTGKAPSVKEVLDNMEEELRSDFEQQWQKVSKTKWGKEKFKLEEHLSEDQPTNYDNDETSEEQSPPPPPLNKKRSAPNLVDTSSNFRPGSPEYRKAKLNAINAKMRLQQQ